MKETANELRQIVSDIVPKLQQLTDAEITPRPAPRKWARKEILGHLIDSPCNNPTEIRTDDAATLSRFSRLRARRLG